MSTASELLGSKVNLTFAAGAQTLATSATVGTQAAAVDATAAGPSLPLDTQIQGTITVGVVSGNKRILFYVAGSFDGGTTYSLGNGANVVTPGAQAFTRADPAGKAAFILPVPNASVQYTFDFPVALNFSGSHPDHWALAVFNDSGVAITQIAAWYKEVRVSVV